MKNFKIFKNFKKFFNESSSNLKMTFWIKIRNNSASTYNRFVSSWKRDDFFFLHHHPAFKCGTNCKKIQKFDKNFKKEHFWREMNLFWLLAISSSVEGWVTPRVFITPRVRRTRTRILSKNLAHVRRTLMILMVTSRKICRQLTWAKLTTARCKKIHNGEKILKAVVEQRRP